MCNLCGLIDFDKRPTAKQKNRILNTLARECESRGTDATDIAYNFISRIQSARCLPTSFGGIPQTV